MRRGAICVASIYWLLIVSTAHAGKWRAIEHVPGQLPVTVAVQGKPRAYFRVAPDAPLTLQLDGPGRLRIVSRAELPRGASHAVSYRLRVAEKDKVLKEQETESSAADGVKVESSDAIVCKSRSFVVGIPQGGHRATISVAGTSSVLVRPLVADSVRSAEAMISITPVEASRSVTVSEGEKLIPYYSVLPGKPVKFRIVGPTSVEISARLDFDATMRGMQPYRLAISQAGHRVREVAFKTTKAATASYTDLKDRAASKISRIVVPLEGGVNELIVELLDPKNGSAEIHARIPQPSVGSEE